MTDDHDENSLYDKPLEFVQSIANSGGGCDGQAILPLEAGGYTCWCSCGAWILEAATSEEGLHAARVHTGSVPATA